MLIYRHFQPKQPLRVVLVPRRGLDVIGYTLNYLWRFRRMKTLQKFASVHAQIHNHFNQERHLLSREIYRQRRSAALVE